MLALSTDRTLYDCGLKSLQSVLSLIIIRLRGVEDWQKLIFTHQIDKPSTNVNCIVK